MTRRDWPGAVVGSGKEKELLLSRRRPGSWICDGDRNQGLRSHDRHDNFKRQEELAIKEESGIIRALNTGGDDGGRPG